MEKSFFEQMGGTYHVQGDYLLPDLTIPKIAPVGVWGQRHLRYLKQNRKVIYTSLLLSGKLDSYLSEVDQQAEVMFSRLVEQMAAQENVTEVLKAANQMTWVGQMNNIRNRVEEIINNDLIYV